MLKQAGSYGVRVIVGSQQLADLASIQLVPILVPSWKLSNILLIALGSRGRLYLWPSGRG
jgi:hypothetical protein